MEIDAVISCKTINLQKDISPSNFPRAPIKSSVSISFIQPDYRAKQFPPKHFHTSLQNKPNRKWCLLKVSLRNLYNDV